MQHLAHFALLVADYDEAIQFYTEVLGFQLSEDTVLSDSKRWVRVTPPGGQTSILLSKADGDQQQSFIGNQTGGRVFLFLYTDDFWRDYHSYQSKGVVFVRPPVEEAYGTVAVFQDLYGNLWDLLQPRT